MLQPANLLKKLMITIFLLTHSHYSNEGNKKKILNQNQDLTPLQRKQTLNCLHFFLLYPEHDMIILSL